MSPSYRDRLFCLEAVRAGLASSELLEKIGFFERGELPLRARLIEAAGLSEQSVSALGAAVDLTLAKFGDDVRAAIDALLPLLLRSASHSLRTVNVSNREPINAEVSGAAFDRVTPEHPGRYEIRGEQGHGGLGRVLVAFDSHIGREIAIKELLEDPAAPSTGTLRPNSARFLREARITGQLEHPNIVPVYELGRGATGKLYYAMRLVRGKTLSQVLGEASTLSKRLGQLGSFWDLCNAVAYAHGRGVIHRDLKPQNVMVGEFGETVLLDWGIAKLGDRAEPTELPARVALSAQDSAELTAAGNAVGTPAYMSPEQARGEVVDERADVWGLGAVLYELLTGAPPFLGDNAISTMNRLLRDPLVPVRQVCPEAPPELAAIAERALQKDPARRYPSAAELTAEIAAYMTGGRVRSYQYSPLELVKRLAERNRPAFVASLVALAAIVAGLVATTLLLGRERAAHGEEAQARLKAQAASAAEHQQRLMASYHLGEAYLGEASRLREEKRWLSASTFAAASLLNNPGHPKSPFYDPDFSRAVPASLSSLAAASSEVFLSRSGELAEYQSTLRVGDVIPGAALSPDETMLAAAAEDRVHLFELGSGAARVLRGHTGQVVAVDFSPDGQRLASASEDGTAVLWELATGRALQTLRGHQGRVVDVRFSPDGRLLATAGLDQTARLWDAATGEQLRTLSGHTDRLTRVAFSPDGRTLATASEDRTVRWYGVADGQARASAPHPDLVRGLAFSPDGSLATACYDGVVRLFDASGRLAQSMAGHTDSAIDVRFANGGKTLVSSGYDKTVRFWELPSGRLLLTLDSHSDYILALVVSASGRLLATGSADGTVRLWRLKLAAAIPTLSGHTESVSALAVTRDGRYAASGAWDRTVRLWDLRSLTLLKTLERHTQAVGGVSFSPDGTRLASVGRDGAVRIWSVPGGELLLERQGFQRTATAVNFSPDGQLLAVTGDDGRMRLLTSAGAEAGILSDHAGMTFCGVFSPDGSRVLTVGRDKLARLSLTRTGQAERELVGHSDLVSGAAFSPDGSRLATSSRDRLAIIWETGSGKELLRLKGHTRWANDLRFSPDGSLVATVGDDRTARLWSARTGQELGILPTSKDAAALEFAPDGRLLVGDGSEIKIYRPDFSGLSEDPRRLLDTAQRRAGARLEGFQLDVGAEPP